MRYVRFCFPYDEPARVAAKLEMRNSCGSVKDRLGVAMIEDADRSAQRGSARSRLGVGFVPQVRNRSMLDEVVAVSDQDAFATARRLAPRREGIVAGISAGAALHAALAIAARPGTAGTMIVVAAARYWRALPDRRALDRRR